MTSMKAAGESPDAGRVTRGPVAVAGLVGLFAGVIAAAASIALGGKCFDAVGGACVHYAAATLLAVGSGAPRRWRTGARPYRATVMVALLVTFVLRRWLTVSVNLEALDWGSGPAGELAAIVLPLEGAVLAAIVALGASGKAEE
jgi:hypothetical protein